MYDENTQNIIIEGNEGYKKAQNFMKIMMPSHVKKIKKYRGKIPLFIQENIDQKLSTKLTLENPLKLIQGSEIYPSEVIHKKSTK